MAKSIGGYVGIGNPILAPDAVFASPSNTVAADASATFTFSAPDNEGLTSVTLFVIVAITSGAIDAVGVGASSPITVTGLTNGTAYTFIIFAINDFGLSPGSFASSAITPSASRGIFSGGQYADAQGSDAWADNMDYVAVATNGNAVDFGDLSLVKNGSAINCSLTRYVSAGGMVGGSGAFGTGTNVIDYVTIASTGDAADFGDCANGAIPNFTGDVANKTRGMQAGGEAQPSGNKDHVSYITIASTGNTTDFGNLVGSRTDGMAGGCSSTRGIFSGGKGFPSGTLEETIDYFTIASTGDATDFGNLANVKGERTCGTSSSTRMVMQFREFIEYVTIASTGNATDFGDPTIRRSKAGTASNNIRALFASGAGDATRSNTPYVNNVIDFVTIATTGDAADFGDLVVAVQSSSGGSNNNGGHQG